MRNIFQSLCRHVDLSEYEDTDITDGNIKISPIISKNKTEKKDKTEDKTENKDIQHETPMDVSEPVDTSAKMKVTGQGDSVSHDTKHQTELPQDLKQLSQGLKEITQDHTELFQSPKELSESQMELPKGQGQRHEGQGECQVSSADFSKGQSTATPTSVIYIPTQHTIKSIDLTLDTTDTGQKVTKADSSPVTQPDPVPVCSTVASLCISTSQVVSSQTSSTILSLSKSSPHGIQPQQNIISDCETLPVIVPAQVRLSPSEASDTIPPNKTTSDIPTAVSYGAMLNLADADILKILSAPSSIQSKPLPLLTKALAEADEEDSKNAQSKIIKEVTASFSETSLGVYTSKSCSVVDQIPPKAHSHPSTQTTIISSPQIAHSRNVPAQGIGLDSLVNLSTPEHRPTSDRLSNSCPSLSQPHFSSNSTHSRSFSVPHKSSVLPLVPSLHLNVSNLGQVSQPISSIPPSSSLTLPLSLGNLSPLTLPITFDNTSSLTLGTTSLSLPMTLGTSNLKQSLPSSLSLSLLSSAHNLSLGAGQGVTSQQDAAQTLMALAQIPIVPQIHSVASSTSFLPSSSRLHSPNLSSSQSLLSAMMSQDVILPTSTHSFHTPVLGMYPAANFM